MSTKKSHYRADTKHGFGAGELAGLLARHSPAADYRVVISFRGKVRELIVDEEEAGFSGQTPRYECETPPAYGTGISPEARLRAQERIQQDREAGRPGGKLQAALHPWPASEDLGGAR